MSMIYLDHQATTPVDPAVLAKMAHVGEHHFANPGSAHQAGAEALGQIDTARAALARFLHARTGEVYFTSGATEANNLAIKGIAHGRRGHIVTTAVEHKSVLDTVGFLGTQGHDVTVLPVDHDGRVSPLQVAECLRPDTLLVSVMLANNEVSTIQPIAEIAEVTRGAGVALHCDATQGAGYVDLDVTALGVDLLSLSGHKIYGPKGVGVLYVSGDFADRVDLTPLCHGGGQERGLRAGTLNTAGIAGLGVAVTLAAEHRSAEATRLAGLRAVFLDELACLAPYELNSGTGPEFLPHAVSLSLTGVDTQELLPSLTDIAISAGSACNATSDKPSHVLTALGLSAARIRSTVRLSVGRFTGLDDVMRAAELLADAAAPLSGGQAAA